MYPKYKNRFLLHHLHVFSQPSHESADSIYCGFAICRIVTILYKELLEKLLKGKTELWSVPGLSALILRIYTRFLGQGNLELPGIAQDYNRSLLLFRLSD